MKDNLPKGIRIDRGYVQIRIMNRGQLYIRNFGIDSSEARELAGIHLAEKRKEILMGKFDIPIKMPRLTFEEVVAQIWLPKWSAMEKPDGSPMYSEKSIRNTKSVVMGSLVPYFGRMPYAEITGKHVLTWRLKKVREVDGTTVNRHQNVLSSIFSHIEDWHKTEQIKLFEIPKENPCQFVAKAETKKRERIPSEYELSKLLLAARTLNDANADQNIRLALKTCLSFNDLVKLQFGDVVRLQRSKTGVGVALPITVLHHPDWKNWTKRWNAIRQEAGLMDIEFRDLRKAGGNLIPADVDPKSISQYMGHSSLKTTEEYYIKMQESRMGPVAKKLSDIVDKL